jgi:hypothetical protein
MLELERGVWWQFGWRGLVWDSLGGVCLCDWVTLNTNEAAEGGGTISNISDCFYLPVVILIDDNESLVV